MSPHRLARRDDEFRSTAKLRQEQGPPADLSVEPTTIRNGEREQPGLPPKEWDRAKRRGASTGPSHNGVDGKAARSEGRGTRIDVKG